MYGLDSCNIRSLSGVLYEHPIGRRKGANTRWVECAKEYGVCIVFHSVTARSLGLRDIEEYEVPLLSLWFSRSGLLYIKNSPRQIGVMGHSGRIEEELETEILNPPRTPTKTILLRIRSL